MPDIVAWATSREWWEYFVTIYACGYAVTVFTHLDTFRAMLPKARDDRAFAEAESEFPRLMAGLLSFVALVAALFWPLELLSKSWWRGLVSEKRTFKENSDG